MVLKKAFEITAAITDQTSEVFLIYNPKLGFRGICHAVLS